MGNILIKQAVIIDPNSNFHNTTADVLIENGIIKNIGQGLSDEGAQEISQPELKITTGFFDPWVSITEPGFEHKEDYRTGTAAAAAGGFTEIGILPDTYPACHSGAEVQFVNSKNNNSIVSVRAIGALSKNIEGKDMAEMYDMHQAGAIAFSDGKKSLNDAGLLMRCMQYSSGFNGVVAVYCNDKSISQGGKMHEGVSSTLLGLKGIPALAEELTVLRNIELAKYCNTPLHLHCISTAGSINAIREAKKQGLKITCDVAAVNLLLDDAHLNDFDTNYKTLPPLRSFEHITSLIEGIKDGTVDFITANHTPQDIELKSKEFDHAAFGIIGLETAFSVANTALQGKVDTATILAKFNQGARNVLRVEIPRIETGQKANLTLFNETVEHTYTNQDIRSKSKNTPFLNKALKGKIIGIINGGHCLLN